MDDRTFDTFVRRMAHHRSRRSLLKGLLGLGGAAMTGALVAAPGEAARRGYAGPLPQRTEETESTACTSQNCFGCRQCVGGVCAVPRTHEISSPQLASGPSS